MHHTITTKTHISQETLLDTDKLEPYFNTSLVAVVKPSLQHSSKFQ